MLDTSTNIYLCFMHLCSEILANDMYILNDTGHNLTITKATNLSIIYSYEHFIKLLHV